MKTKILLAWRQLAFNKARLFAAIAGIVFADVLMFIQIGFNDALYVSNTQIHQSLNADIILISAQTQNILYMESFSRRRLYQSLSIEGVQSASPLYLNFGRWKNPFSRRRSTILGLAFNPEEVVLKLEVIGNSFEILKQSDTVLFDQKSRLNFGTSKIVENIKNGEIVYTEVAGKRIKILGLFNLGTSFAADGHFITSDSTFWKIFPQRNPSQIDIGIIKIKPNQNLTRIVEDIKKVLPNDVVVFSKNEFIEFEKAYWQENSPIGVIFGLGLIIGFIVGSVIVYQILFTDITDHLSEYATLKAIGYKDNYFFGVVLQESIILGGIGYIPGFIISMIIYSLAADLTLLPISMKLEPALFVLMLTIFMCSVSGFIAIFKLYDADPSEIF